MLGRIGELVTHLLHFLVVVALELDDAGVMALDDVGDEDAAPIPELVGSAPPRGLVAMFCDDVHICASLIRLPQYGQYVKISVGRSYMSCIVQP